MYCGSTLAQRFNAHVRRGRHPPDPSRDAQAFEEWERRRQQRIVRLDTPQADERVVLAGVLAIMNV